MVMCAHARLFNLFLNSHVIELLSLTSCSIVGSLKKPSWLGSMSSRRPKAFWRASLGLISSSLSSSLLTLCLRFLVNESPTWLFHFLSRARRTSMTSISGCSLIASSTSSSSRSLVVLKCSSLNSSQSFFDWKMAPSFPALQSPCRPRHPVS